jgi:hypothetical protein
MNEKIIWLATLLLAAATFAEAQSPGKVAKIGWLAVLRTPTTPGALAAKNTRVRSKKQLRHSVALAWMSSPLGSSLDNSSPSVNRGQPIFFRQFHGLTIPPNVLARADKVIK